MSNRPVDMELTQAQSWVPCGSHPQREPGDCCYCAIDTLVDAYRESRAELAALRAEAGRVRSKAFSEAARICDSRIVGHPQTDRLLEELADIMVDKAKAALSATWESCCVLNKHWDEHSLDCPKAGEPAKEKGEARP